MGWKVLAKALAAGFGKRATTKYPKQKKPCEKYRGLPRVDPKKCISCGTCQRVCPANACVVNKLPQFDLQRCCLCGQCAFFCPKQAIKMTNEYELVFDARAFSKIRPGL